MLMMMDMISNVNENNWERPVYYAITASRDNYLNMEKYLHRTGLAYRLLPVSAGTADLFTGSVDTDKMYDNLMNVFVWGNIQDPSVYLDENNLRMLTNFRYSFASLASALIDENKVDSAIQVLDKAMELMPNSRVPYNYAIVPFIQFYYSVGEIEKANAIVREFAAMTDQELYYYEALSRRKPAKFSLSSTDFAYASRNLFSMFQIASEEQQQELADELMKMLQAHDQ
jgi:predicted Zn-dependent protease